eukprot:1190460-Prorocentrum_minimum.AAC.1
MHCQYTSSSVCLSCCDLTILATSLTDVLLWWQIQYLGRCRAALKGSSPVTVVMGNEAADLDSCVRPLFHSSVPFFIQRLARRVSNQQFVGLARVSYSEFCLHTGDGPHIRLPVGHRSKPGSTARHSVGAPNTSSAHQRPMR